MRFSRCIVLSLALASGAAAQNRIFMTAVGGEQDGPATGNTVVAMAPGSTLRIEVWLDITSDPFINLFAGYQLIFQWHAVGGDSGMISYVDNGSGPAGGDSILIDTQRPEWVFAKMIAVSMPSYNETPSAGIFGAIYNTALPIEFFAPPLSYLVEFDVRASPDAMGAFEFLWNIQSNGGAPPFSEVFAPGGADFDPDLLFQNLTILVHVCGDGQLHDPEECDDDNTTPGDGCAADCLIEFCGDGVVNNAGREECDDGNNRSGDGCTADCVVEFCGDAVVNNGGIEECDDGNTVSFDGCSTECLIESAVPPDPEIPVLTGPGMALLIACLVIGLIVHLRRTTVRR